MEAVAIPPWSHRPLYSPCCCWSYTDMIPLWLPTKLQALPFVFVVIVCMTELRDCSTDVLYHIWVYASLSYEKGFGTVGVQSKNPLLEGDKVSVFQKAQTLCHLWKYCASSLLERNPSCFRERAPCRAVVLCLRLKKVVATQQWKMDDANCKYGCF